jgi:hypothetical protein
MTTNEELDRLRTAFAAPAGPGAAPEAEDCPPSDQIWLAVRGELPPDELRKIVDHTATCPSCAEDWRIAMAFEEGSRTTVVPATDKDVHPKDRTARRRAWMAVAASIFAVMIGLQFLWPKGPNPQPEYRGGGGGQAGIHSLVQGEALPRETFILRWEPVPGAESYDVEVNDSDLDPLYRAEGLTTPVCQVPAGKLAGLRPGDKVYWKVTPVARGGALQFQTFTNRLK